MRTARKFPYLSAYLEKLDEQAGRALVASVPVVAWSTSALIVAFAILLVGLVLGKWVAGVLFGLAFASIVVTAWTAAVTKHRLANDPREQRRRLVFKTGHNLRDMEVQRKLHLWMDPVALHLLEAGSFHWTRIQTALAGPQWGARDLPNYWSQLKTQVAQASDEGMGDLLVLASNCVGPPQKDRQSDIQGVVESFVDLDFADAISGLKQLAKADWTNYAHQSPQAEAIAVHGRRIAERLRELADDVEAKAAEIAIESATSGGVQSLDSLEGVLSELRTVRQAESELDERINQGL